MRAALPATPALHKSSNCFSATATVRTPLHVRQVKPEAAPTFPLWLAR